MKQIWPNYSYSPATNVLTLSGLNIDRDQLLLVTAADRGRIMYNFADSSVTASAFTSGANTALTLVATTAGLTTTAALVIYYDDQLQSTSVSISNLPSTQTIAGTVTANVFGVDYAGTLIQIPVETDSNNIGDKFIPIGFNVLGEARQVSYAYPLPISGTVTIGSALPAGTNRIGVVTIGGGTVTIGAGTSQIGSVTASISNFPASTVVCAYGLGSDGTWRGLEMVPGSNRLKVDAANLSGGSSFPISGSVTLGSGTSQIGSVTASISGTVPVSGTFWQATQPASLASLPALAAGTAQIGSVTASLAISSSAITSGSFTSLTSATLVPANTARKMATVYNLGAGQLFINAGATATTLGGGFMVALSSGDFYECDYTTTTLSAIFATAGTASWVSH